MMNLSPAQMKNLQDELDVKVMDRTLIILDIFAARASTSEGKIQVELAQLKVSADQTDRLGEERCPDWEAELEPEDRERRNWRWIAA